MKPLKRSILIYLLIVWILSFKNDHGSRYTPIRIIVHDFFLIQNLLGNLITAPKKKYFLHIVLGIKIRLLGIWKKIMSTAKVISIFFSIKIGGLR